MPELIIPRLELLHAADLDFREPPPGTATGDRRILIESLISRRSIHSRNGIAWVGTRSWRAEAKASDIAALKRAKERADVVVIKRAAQDVAEVIRMLFGDLSGWTVSTTAVGHSRRPDSFAVQMAEGVAQLIGRPFLKVFEDRFIKGASHPKEFKDLPPLRLRSKIKTPILIVDDVATSGWHMEEAARLLRGRGNLTFGIVWISGTIQ